MGWLDGLKRIKDPVRGSAQIVTMTQAPDDATSGNCRMQLVVSVPGHPSFAIDDQYIVKVQKWPSPGQTLPIEASQSDPSKFKILWDEIQAWDVTGASQAQQLAEAMNQQQPQQPPEPGAPPQPGQVHPSMIMINGRQATPEELKQYEVMTGMDLDGDGKIAGGAAAPGGGLQGMIQGAMAAAQQGFPGMQQAAPPAGTDEPSKADDRVAAIERLAALKASGAITEAEFETEKARILDS
jgi:Short C-terminal domain